MENVEAKIPQSPPQKTRKVFIGAQIFLRISTVVSTLVSLWLTLTSKQTVQLFGMLLDARYSYSPAFKYFAYANAIVSAFTFLSLFFALIINRRGGSNPANHFILFLHDLCMMSLLLSGCAAGTAIGYVGKYGEKHSGWMPVCDQFGKFCSRITVSMTISYVGVFFLLMLTVISANRATQIQV